MNETLKPLLNIVANVHELTDDEKKALSQAANGIDQAFTDADSEIKRLKEEQETIKALLQQANDELAQSKETIEAQNRELEIEAALEKIRHRTMVMNHSSELPEVAAVVVSQLNKLGVSVIRCWINIFQYEDEFLDLWMTVNGAPEAYPINIKLPLSFFEENIRHWKAGNEILEKYYPPEEAAQFIAGLRQLTGDTELAPDEYIKERRSFYFLEVKHKFGTLGFASEESNTHIKHVLLRFAKTFEQTYTRLLDLKTAEAQTVEAVKQSSLDRLRAETASMRTTGDLERITPLIWAELTNLQVRFIRCGVFIMDESEQQIQIYLSTPDGKAIASFHLPFYSGDLTNDLVNSWRANRIYTTHWSAEEFSTWTTNLVEQGAIKSGEKYIAEMKPTDLHLHFVPFLQGSLYVGNTTPLNAEEIKLLQSLADAFSTAYARYEDFGRLETAKQQIERALADLESAQTQLVHQEKMAYLGELTAGIAHEIQNPLNFVNNFSEATNELIDDLQAEVQKGDLQEIKALAADIKANAEKIVHHGKRADSIVKSMLLHSRRETGQKELIDLNALCDEYLRLSYHGLRAKDKNFNLQLHTEFDEQVGKVNVIPQDLGRVLLNLCNNAFYAVQQKQKRLNGAYEPFVQVGTRKREGMVEITVKDNGDGIPEKVLTKIYQPFFTTKPTGEGTGLGLSLCYDIITKGHGGQLAVESKEGEGTEFVVRLPVA